MDILLKLLKSATVIGLLADAYVKYARPALKKLVEDDNPDLDFNDHVYNAVDGFLSRYFKVEPDPV